MWAIIGWVVDLLVLAFAFSLDPVCGFVWLILNVVFIVVRMVNAHERNKLLIAEAQLRQQQEYLDWLKGKK